MRQLGIPFRWNVANPRLPRRLGASPAETPEGFKEDLLRLAAGVLRAAGDTDLVFVGRSPENAYDLLSGALSETSWRDRLQLLQLSLREATPGRLRRERPRALPGLWLYFQALGLTPEQILARPRRISFVDLVHSGETFGNLLRVLRSWVEPLLWPRLLERLRWVCIVETDHPRWMPWEPSYSAWPPLFREGEVRTVPIDWRLWRYLGEDQVKTTQAYTPQRWGRENATWPPRLPRRLQAARLARALYRLGEWRRERLAAELERPPAPERWRSELIRELRLA